MTRYTYNERGKKRDKQLYENEDGEMSLIRFM